MSTNDPHGAELEQDLSERIMDWSLGERLGGERVPDLRAAVVARLAKAPARGPQRWLAAAILLLGVVAVCGVAMWPRRHAEPVPVAPAPVQEPKREFASTVAEADALPATTRAVEVSCGDDEVIAALTRLHELEVIIVREPYNESFGLGLKIAAPAEVRHITSASWAHFAKFTKLRRLELRGTVLVGRFGADTTAEAVAGLERLPLLESVTLRCLDTRDAVLKRLGALRNLRTLDLSFNHGFAEEGLRELLHCTSLRKVTLSGCQQLHGNWLAMLQQLPELEELDVSAIDGMNWRNGTAEPMDEEGTRVLREARGWADSLQTGVTDEALAGFAKCPKLRILDASGGRWSAAGLAALGESASLRELNMFGGQVAEPGFVASLPQQLERLEVCGEYDDRLCVAIREHLTKLRSVTVAACYQITDRGIEELCAMPSLRVLDMGQMRGLTAECVTTLAKAKQLEELDLRHNDWLTVAHVLAIKRALPKLRQVLTNFSTEELAAAEQLPPAEKAFAKEQIERFAVGTRNVETMIMGDECVPALLRLQDLERLSIQWYRGNVSKSITADGLRQLASLPNLRYLVLGKQTAIGDSDLVCLAEFRQLESIQISGMRISDAALASLTKLPRLRQVYLVDCGGFGEDGLRSLAACASLREVSLQGTVSVQPDWLVPLVGRDDLEWLDLSRVGEMRALPRAGPVREVAQADSISEQVLEALGKATGLRYLDLSDQRFLASNLKHLQGLPRLRTLKLERTSVAAGDLRWLPPGIEVLSLSGCVRLGAAFGEDLAAAFPRLQSLELRECTLTDEALKSLGGCKRVQTLDLATNASLTDGCLRHLQNLRSLRSLDLSYCRGFTVNAVRELTKLTWLEDLTLRDWDQLQSEDWDTLRRMPNLKTIRNSKFFERLR
jgi:Leucine-rich repeat (LRR) protein